LSISVISVSKSFGGFKALDNVSLDLPAGKLVALLGPSGCGKTTLLRVIAGLERPQSGRVIIDGRDADDLDAAARQVGFVFQHYALFRHMTVFENIAFGLRVKRPQERPSDADIIARVNELLSMVQLEWLADRYPAQLSGGQRQRIALARALAVKPRVLLLDEPFGALDAQVRLELRRWLRRLHEDLHITTIFVTHDQDEALDVADQIVLVNRGRVEQVGSAQDVYEHPATAFAYRFLGGANRIDGTIDGDHLITVSGRLEIEPDTLGSGQAATAYARPHELTIGRPGDSGLKARLHRAMPRGGAIVAELSLIDDTQVTLSVEIPRGQWADLAAHQTLETGALVSVIPTHRRLRVFAADSTS
jgi:sulfate transport system ATP-binding protein